MAFSEQNRNLTKTNIGVIALYENDKVFTLPSEIALRRIKFNFLTTYL